jgi:hypothetical protein
VQQPGRLPVSVVLYAILAWHRIHQARHNACGMAEATQGCPGVAPGSRLPYAQARAWGYLGLAHWPISGSRWGGRVGGASQVGVVQRRKSVQRSRRPIAAATLTITRLQKDHDLRPLTPAARISAVNRRVPVRCPITRQQIQALTCPAPRRSRSIRRPRVLGMRNAGPAVAYGNRAAAVIVRVAT